MRSIRALMFAACSTAFAALPVLVPATSQAQVSVGVSITIAPPPLPVYAQPPIPADGYVWIPGYWAYGPYGYYWIPGTWVLPPGPGLLWTPAYWAWEHNVFVFHRGYWGERVGFYGGIDYGFGYGGVGYEGGYWDHGVFCYNRAVTNIRSVHVTKIYTKTVVNNVSVTRVSYNGGAHGTQARPTSRDETFAHEHHVAPTALQVQHEHAASSDHALRASVNHGRPTIAATSKPGYFKGHGTVPARNASAQHTAHPQTAPQPHKPVMHNESRPAEAPRPGSPPHAEPPHGGTAPDRGGSGHGGSSDRHQDRGQNDDRRNHP